MLTELAASVLDIRNCTCFMGTGTGIQLGNWAWALRSARNHEHQDIGCSGLAFNHRAFYFYQNYFFIFRVLSFVYPSHLSPNYLYFRYSLFTVIRYHDALSCTIRKTSFTHRSEQEVLAHSMDQSCLLKRHTPDGLNSPSVTRSLAISLMLVNMKCFVVESMHWLIRIST